MEEIPFKKEIKQGKQITGKILHEIIVTLNLLQQFSLCKTDMILHNTKKKKKMEMMIPEVKFL